MHLKCSLLNLFYNKSWGNYVSYLRYLDKDLLAEPEFVLKLVKIIEAP